MSKQRRIAIAAILVVAAGTLIRFTVFDSGSRTGAILASGTVEATQAHLGFQAPGRIEAIAVREGDPVDSSSELAALDRAELLARRRAAEAQVAAARAGLSELQRGFRAEEVAQGRAGLRAAEQLMNDARRDHERTLRLFEGGAVSRQTLDHQETAFQLAEAAYQSAREQLGILETGPRSERIAAQRARLAQVEALVGQIDAALDNAVIRAPFDGMISVRHREPGEIVQPGAAVLTLINPGDRWVRIYVREDEVGRINIGQQATITADTYPDRTYQGVVIFIASEAEFTPRNIQTIEERVKLVYRVKVRITGDASYDLKPGLAADVRIEIEAT